jgi:hypothetical protein
MSRNLHNSLTLHGGINTRIACAFCFCGLIPSQDNIYHRCNVFLAQNGDLHAVTFSHACCNLIKTLFGLLRWSSRLNLVMHNRPSMKVWTNSRVSISSDILAWKMSREHAMPIGNLRYGYFLKWHM